MKGFQRLVACLMGAALLVTAGCGDDDGNGSQSQSFAMQFAAVDGNQEVGCGDVLNGLGPQGANTVEISDMRLYISNLRFVTADGDSVPAELDSSDFQYIDENGSVALIDFTDTASGACSGSGLTYPEGTARMNTVITGKRPAEDIERVTFDVALPQALMKDVIADNTAEGAPSPLAEMHWSWAYAYRFVVMNFVVADGEGGHGEGYLHVGSNDCGGDGTKALTDQEACGKPNAATVSLTGFDVDTDTVAVDVRQLLSGIDFEITPQDAPTIPGVECHSSSQQPDCATIFNNLGIDQATGSANASINDVFSEW